MNEEPMQAVEPQAGEELERMLARYVRVRLEPSPAETRRARAAVMEEARRLHLAAGRGAAAPVRALAHPRSGIRSLRRVAVAMLAASLAGLLLGTSVFAASRAGGPLYETRLAVEELTLPADPGARLEAELAGAQARVAEVVDAAARGDDTALAAALVAYEASASRIETTSGPDAERVLAAVQQHRAILLQVLAGAPPAAVDGLTRALSESDRLIERLQARATGSPSGGPGTTGGSGVNGNADGGGNAGADGNPGDKGGPNAGGGEAHPTPRADRTPGPAKPPKPDSTKETPVKATAAPTGDEGTQPKASQKP